MLIESDIHKALTTVAPVQPLMEDFAQLINPSRAPFSSLPKADYFFQYPSAMQALNTIAFSLKAGESIVKISGEKGVGKTFLIRQSVRVLGSDYYVMQCINANISAVDFLKFVIEEFGALYSVNTTENQLLKHLQCLLYEHYSKTDYPIVIWVDDAQQLPMETLALIGSMCEFQTNKRKLVQFILSGTSEFDEKINHISAKNLRHHIGHSETLRSLNQSELMEYLKLRLQHAGMANDFCFTPAAARLLYRKSKGLPRNINAIANKALMLTYGKGGKIVPKAHVVRAARECGWVSADDSGFLFFFCYLPILLAMMGVAALFGLEWIAL